ncbi:MAG TPA: MFS transporter [Anaerolineales bacterium]|nr:MFS transporter [Anaerolineales bacterium]
MENIVKAGQRTTRTLFLVMSAASAGTIGMATVNPILAADLSGQAAWAGLPTAIYLLGAALSAPLWGLLMDRLGRRRGILLGLVLGMAGAAAVQGALSLSSLAVFLGAMGMIGVASAAVQLSRFSAAEVHPPELRGRAISNVVLGGTVGAIAGPLLVGPAGRWAVRLGLEELGGPYLQALLLFTLAAAIVFVGLRPDPRELGREVARLYSVPAVEGSPRRPLGTIFRGPDAFLALSAMVLGQMVMVMLMVITSLHMRNHDHSLMDLSLVISSHTLGMYAFSVVSGRLSDRWGRHRVILAGSFTLVVACLAATLTPDVLPLAMALFLLGLGWNFCYVGGSTLLADQLTPAERARSQGFNDLMVGLASAAGSLASGLVFDAVGFVWMGWVGAALALVPLLQALRRGRLAAHSRLAGAAPG